MDNRMKKQAEADWVYLSRGDWQTNVQKVGKEFTAIFWMNLNKEREREREREIIKINESLRLKKKRKEDVAKSCEESIFHSEAMNDWLEISTLATKISWCTHLQFSCTARWYDSWLPGQCPWFGSTGTPLGALLCLSSFIILFVHGDLTYRLFT